MTSLDKNWDRVESLWTFWNFDLKQIFCCYYEFSHNYVPDNQNCLASLGWYIKPCNMHSCHLNSKIQKYFNYKDPNFSVLQNDANRFKRQSTEQIHHTKEHRDKPPGAAENPWLKLLQTTWKLPNCTILLLLLLKQSLSYPWENKLKRKKLILEQFCLNSGTVQWDSGLRVDRIDLQDWPITMILGILLPLVLGNHGIWYFATSGIR